jgi:hypothetical protein
MSQSAPYAAPDLRNASPAVLQDALQRFLKGTSSQDFQQEPSPVEPDGGSFGPVSQHSYGTKDAIYIQDEQPQFPPAQLAQPSLQLPPLPSRAPPAFSFSFTIPVNAAWVQPGGTMLSASATHGPLSFKALISFARKDHIGLFLEVLPRDASIAQGAPIRVQLEVSVDGDAPFAQTLNMLCGVRCRLARIEVRI